MKERYAKLLPFIVNRSDLNYVLGEMIGELNVSHSYVYGGDIDNPETIGVGYLGCDYVLEDGYYKITKTIDAGDWNAFNVRSPLTEPGVDVSEGDYLIAVNHKPVDSSLPVYAAFQGLDGKTVTITVNDKPSTDGAREVVVKTLSSESDLRHYAWVNSNLEYVDEQTGGKVGYIYVPNTGREGQNELYRQFMGQVSKDALIIDERFNGGGQIPDRFVELLGRKNINYWARQDFKSFSTPYVTHDGPKVMLINGWAGSGGDAFPYYFQKQGVGPLVGKRTWGGLVGISFGISFIDGGAVTAPSFGFYTLDKGWEIENYGVDPDYEIENPPNLLYQGIDKQLDKSIEVVKDLLKTNPPPTVTKPEYPDRSK
jgi:tricorn protease